ncbi:MAG: hypothetical protein ACRC7R_02770 [Sarcina sp.]
MNEQFISNLIQEGIFLFLFVWLFWETRKDAKEREKILLDIFKEIHKDKKDGE